MMSPSSEPTVGRFGLTEVYAPPDGGAKVDIVFVHGLNGDPHRSWTSEKSKIFWPWKLLPAELDEEKARILVYGYDADVTSFTDGVSKDKIHNHAENLVAVLAANRRKSLERPIVFVAHSLGGLVVKRALIYSSEIRGNYTERLRSIFVSTYGILFLGTPHKGSDVAQWGSRLEGIVSAVAGKLVDSQPQLVNALKNNNETLQNIDRQFVQIMGRFHIYFFHEGKPTNLKIGMRYIVDEESASPTAQDVERAVIQQDHSHMCKFENASAPGFDLLTEGIQRYAAEAPPTVSLRWHAEMAERNAKKRAEVEELLPGSMKGTPKSDSTSTTTPTPDTSQILSPKDLSTPAKPDMKDDATNTTTTSLALKPNQPYFIVPPGFRPNTFFVGMDKESQEMDRRLFDKRRRVGTACVLLHGQPGAGKSHLARQYVHKNRQKFNGGVFWINAKSKEERYHAFWNIKESVVIHEAPALCEGDNGDDFVKSVKSWFEARHEWLMVFDGVVLERDKDATELQNFIPDSTNSSIIYISRAKNLESKQRLLRPFPIKVGPLKEDDAKKLLFKELHIDLKKVSEADKKKVTELVRQTGGLPLAVNAISHRLADTHEPLAKYKLSYSDNHTIEATYNKILDDLLRLGHMEAWHLINILCWFGQNIPVEMVHLGLKILRTEKIEVKAIEHGGNPDLNTTFGVLMRYALIERNEPETDKDSMSSSHDSVGQPEPIDMLKIHSVVQSFCCDSLNARGLLPQWLGYAVKLFSYSYHQADIKIKQRPEPARVSDYRYYLVHGQRLWDHSASYGSKTQPLEHLRAVLHPVIDMINEEIRAREPGSSQESLKNGIFQISIFDRTSSSSDSGPSVPGPPTPDHHPPPQALDNETLFGFPIDKPVDSPDSFEIASPGLQPKILNNSPASHLLEYDDVGYDSDREGKPTSHPMRPNLSDVTAKPPSRARSRAPTTESRSGGWQAVPSSRKPPKPRGRRDLGSFRPTPARAKVDKENVQRPSDAAQLSPNGKERRRDSSPAVKALEDVQSRSPPPSRGIASLFRPTWAGIAAGKHSKALQMPIDAPIPSIPSPPPLLLERVRSRENLQREGNAQSSPLASELVPRSSPIEGSASYQYDPAAIPYPTTGLQYATPYPGSSSTLSHYSQPRPIASTHYFTPPPALGPNLAALPLDESVTITYRRPLPADLRADQRVRTSPSHLSQSPHSRTSPNNQTLDNPYPPPLIPAGYYSQPMSRDHSHQSYTSIAETEPLHHPSKFSPQVPPTVFPNSDPLRYHPTFTSPNFTLSDSPRERAADGRLVRESPNTDYVLSSTPEHPALSHIGDWTSPNDAMSRSSSGPGVALPESTGKGLGIVQFGNTGQVQFGTHVPISLDEAKRRTFEHELRLRERRREVRPYPDANLIPGATDAAFLERIVGNGGSERGGSEPEVDDVEGLEVRL